MDRIESQSMLALLGAGLLFVGAFAPIFAVPIVGDQTFMQNGQLQGFIILALAVVTVFLTLRKQFRALWLPGLASLATIAISYFIFRSELSDAGEDIPFRELRDAALGSIQLKWGWAVLLLGALLVCAAAWQARSSEHATS